MKSKLLKLAAALSLAASGTVIAGGPPDLTITATPNSGVEGATLSVSIDFADGATGQTGVQYEVTYDMATFTPSNCTVLIGGLTSCSDIDDGSVNFAHLGSLTDGTIATFDLTIDPGAVGGMYPLAFNLVNYTGNGNIGGQNGDTVTVLVPDIAATVNPVDFGSPVVVPPGPGIGTMSTVISNSGDPGTTLTGTCALGGGMGITADQDPLVLSLAAGASETVNFTCDTSSISTNNDTYACTMLNAASGATLNIPVTCDVVAPGPATFGSTPTAPGGTFEIVALPGVLPNTGTQTNTLTLQNTAAAGNGDLTNLACTEGAGDAAITIQTQPAGTIAAGGSSGLVLACDTTGAAVGTLSRAIDCDYELDTPPDGNDGPSSYTAECEIRAAVAAITPNPNGGNLNITVIPGGTGTADVRFSETNNEGVDVTDLDCTLATGTDFTILSPAFPATIPSGGSVTVDVEGTDPDNMTMPTDTMTCTYTDGAGAQNVVFNLGFIIRPLVVPTLSQWGMILMALGLFGFGAYQVRRRGEI